MTQITHAAIHERQSFLKERYAVLNHTIQNSDWPGFKSWMANNATPDFTLRTSDGNIVTAAATLNSMKNQFLVIRAVKSSTFRLSNLSLHEDHISVSVKTHLDAVTKDGRHIVEDSLAVDTWRNVKRQWKLATLVTTKDKVAVNGKVTHSIGISLGEVFP